MKSFRLNLDDPIVENIGKIARKLGVQPQSYIQMIIGLHANGEVVPGITAEVRALPPPEPGSGEKQAKGKKG